MNKIALNLCIVFAPLFITCFLFDATKPFFSAWAKFTVSTLFTLAVLTVIVTIAMKAILVVSATLLAADLASGSRIQLRDIATVSGGLGMLMTTLLLGGPPLMTHFFSGAVATFQNYNAVGGAAKPGGAPSSPQELASTGFVGANTQETQRGAGNTDAPNNFVSRAPYGGGSTSNPNHAVSGQRGQAKQQTA